MISKFKNKKSGDVIDWDSDKGLLLTTVWEAVEENSFTITTNPETVDAAVELITNYKPEAPKEIAAAYVEVQPVVEEELEQVQTFSSLAKLIENADTTSKAVTKAGVFYEHNGEKWVKA